MGANWKGPMALKFGSSSIYQELPKQFCCKPKKKRWAIRQHKEHLLIGENCDWSRVFMSSQANWELQAYQNCPVKNRVGICAVNRTKNLVWPDINIVAKGLTHYTSVSDCVTNRIFGCQLIQPSPSYLYALSFSKTSNPICFFSPSTYSSIPPSANLYTVSKVLNDNKTQKV